MLRAGPAEGVAPVLLLQPRMTAKGLVEFRPCAHRRGGAAGGRGTGRDHAEVEVAFVGIFLAAGVKPGVEVGIGNRFLGLMSENVNQAISSAYAGCGAVGPGRLAFAARGAAIGVAYKSPFNVRSVECLAGMETAELAAESLLFDVGGRQHHIDAVGIRWQSVGGGPGNDRREVVVGQSGALVAGN